MLVYIKRELSSYTGLDLLNVKEACNSNSNGADSAHIWILVPQQ